MTDRYEYIKTRIMIVLLIELIIITVSSTLFPKLLITLQFLAVIINGVLLVLMYYEMVQTYQERVFSISKILGNEAKSAFKFGEIGILTYDADYTITWTSEFFDDLESKEIGNRLFVVFPGIKKFFESDKETVVISYGGRKLEVTGFEHENTLFFKDITTNYYLEEENKNNQVVLGIAHLDNYEETTQYEEEQTIAFIDSNIRQAVARWADFHDMYVRRIRQDRYLLVLNERIFSDIEDEKFSIIHEIREEARKIDASITLSLAFARKSESLKELEDMSNKALELAQSRGGDQVAINTKNEGMKYFGGNTEAFAKRSKVRVRVMAQNLGELISKSNNIFIMGHKMSDFDSFSSGLGLSAIANVYDKDVSIVVNLEDTEQNLKDHILRHKEQLEKNNRILSSEEALKEMDDRSLLILTDHHSVSQTLEPRLIEKSQRIVVIDHHRRTEAFEFKPVLTYIESSASSASELVIELFPYHKRNVVISSLEATFMYTGMLIDTNRFRNRSNSRTFQAAAELRKFGADLGEVEDMLRDEYGSFELKNKILSTIERFESDYVIAAYKDEYIPRVLMSQVADEIISVRDIEASFVLAYVSEDLIAISARSNGDLNVQRVMEKMGGGGHFTGAAAQIKGRSFSEVLEKLKIAIIEIREESDRE